MVKKTIELTTQEDLKVFMSPQRQRLLRKMQVAGKPVTAKAVADMLGVSTSSAQFHLRKLEKLGVVELDHTEVINGIWAKFYRMAPVNVRIGSRLEDNLSNERYVVMQNLIKGTFDNLIDFYKSGLPKEQIKKNSEFISGFVNLTPKDAQELLLKIKTFIESREKCGPDTQAWEFNLMLYNAGIAGTAEAKNRENEKAGD